MFITGTRCLDGGIKSGVGWPHLVIWKCCRLLRCCISSPRPYSPHEDALRMRRATLCPQDRRLNGNLARMRRPRELKVCPGSNVWRSQMLEVLCIRRLMQEAKWPSAHISNMELAVRVEVRLTRKQDNSRADKFANLPERN